MPLFREPETISVGKDDPLNQKNPFHKTFAKRFYPAGVSSFLSFFVSLPTIESVHIKDTRAT